MARRRHCRNEIRHEVTDYGVDPVGARMHAQLTAHYGLVARGLTSASILGEKGDPGLRFDGLVAHSGQQFHGVAWMAHNPVTYRETTSELGNSLGAGTPLALADPARRVFAERLRQRRT